MTTKFQKRLRKNIGLVRTHELNHSRFGKQRAKSTDAMRSSGRKTPTPETGIPSSGLAPGPGQESGRRDEDAAREKMMNEQAKIQQHYKRLVQQQQEAESAAMNAAAADKRRQGSDSDVIYTGQHSMPPPALPQQTSSSSVQSREPALPASLAAARPGSRTGITGTPTDPRFANYDEIQRHLNRRQAQYHSQVEISTLQYVC